jgi:hypothetical protein
MRSLAIFWFFCLSLFSAQSFAQTVQSGNCAELMNGVRDARAFIVGTSILLSSQEISSPVPVDRPVVRICVAVDPARHASEGMVNIRYQIYDATTKPQPGSDQVEYQARRSNRRMQFAERGNGTERAVNIQEYQNYHGCRDSEAYLRGRSYRLYYEFHAPVAGQRSDTLNRRRRFLFTKDVGAACNIVTSGAAGLLEGFSWTGVSQAFGFTSADVSRIIARRSANIRFRFPEDGMVRYVGYTLPPLEPGRCARIAANQVFWRDGMEIGSDREPRSIAYLCTKHSAP